jgi:hypothetical protein
MCKAGSSLSRNIRFVSSARNFLLHPCPHCVSTAALDVKQGRVKGFVGPRHLLLLGRFRDSKCIVGTAVCSRLSGLKKGDCIYG